MGQKPLKVPLFKGDLGGSKCCKTTLKYLCVHRSLACGVCGHDITEFAIALVFVPAITPPANELVGVLLSGVEEKAVLKQAICCILADTL
ncbi:MAG: hypothetical protein ICV54_26985 [Nostoc sp. C3-bin3]|nr:hypothetical protein [Nostoc sp. C3-bin3]